MNNIFIYYEFYIHIVPRPRVFVSAGCHLLRVRLFLFACRLVYNKVMDQPEPLLTVISHDGRRRFELIRGDLTRESVDAIVNAANSHLLHGGGVAAAIARAGGPAIQAESREWVAKNGPASPQRPGLTSGGRLPCRYVIHAVGPVWGEGEETEKLSQALRSAVALAEALGCASLALPAISTGIFGFPLHLAAPVFRDEIAAWLRTEKSSLRLIRLVLLEPAVIQAFLPVLNRLREA